MHFLCLVHSLECHYYFHGRNPNTTNCQPGDACGYIISLNEGGREEILRQCMPKEDEGSDWIIGKCWIKYNIAMTCACDTDNCNHDCSTDKCPPIASEEDFKCNTTCKAAEVATTTDASSTTQKKTDQTDDNARATSEDGPQPTDDSSGATGEDGPEPTEDGTGGTGKDGPQPTEDKSGATADDAEETQKPTGKASTNSANQRNLWMLATLVIRSFYYKQTVTNALFINN